MFLVGFTARTRDLVQIPRLAYGSTNAKFPEATAIRVCRIRVRIAVRGVIRIVVAIRIGDREADPQSKPETHAGTEGVVRAIEAGRPDDRPIRSRRAIRKRSSRRIRSPPRLAPRLCPPPRCCAPAGDTPMSRIPAASATNVLVCERVMCICTASLLPTGAVRFPNKFVKGPMAIVVLWGRPVLTIGQLR